MKYRFLTSTSPQRDDQKRPRSVVNKLRASISTPSRHWTLLES